MEDFIGTIKLFAGNFAPEGWAFCNGQVLPITRNEALFKIISNFYGGDGVNNFALPDLCSRVPVGAGVGKGTNLTAYKLGQKAGQEKTKLIANNIPLLSGVLNLGSLSGNATGNLTANTTTAIAIPCSDSISSDLTPSNHYIANNGVGGFSTISDATLKSFNANSVVNIPVDLPVKINGANASVTVNQNSSTEPANVVQPVLGLNYIICIKGFYPTEESNRRRILIDGKETQEFNVKNYNYFHQIGSSPEKKKIIRVNNPFDKSKYSFNPIIQVLNTENYNDVFATSLAGPWNGDYFEVVIYRIDGDSWAQNLFMRISFNYYENEF
jgi:microcystin-dependent protein